MKTRIPKKPTAVRFAQWLKENTLCSLRFEGERVEAVVSAGHIEPNLCVPLIAEMNDEILEITEFAEDYFSLESAYKAIDNGEETYPPVPFHDWVQDQYLTAKDVKITRVEI
jgi:hypothetical protein